MVQQMIACTVNTRQFCTFDGQLPQQLDANLRFKSLQAQEAARG
jgi:hypothetical protein